MTLYQLWSDHTYRTFEEETMYKPIWFRGEPVTDWPEPELYPSAHHTEKDKEIGDVIPVDVSAVVVNQCCFEVIKPLVLKAAQILPAKWEAQKLFVLNVTNVIDCLDHEKSKVKRFAGSGRIMRVEEYAFYREMLKNASIFKIPEEAHTHPYVTDAFKDLIEQNGIKGFQFVPVWQDRQ